VHATEEVAMSDESPQDRPDETDEADEKAQKPGESDTETAAGFPKEGGESGQSKQNE
jgi:hypothetical protein